MSVSFPFVFMQKSTFDRACFVPRAVCLTTLVWQREPKGVKKQHMTPQTKQRHDASMGEFEDTTLTKQRLCPSQTDA